MNHGDEAQGGCASASEKSYGSASKYRSVSKYSQNKSLSNIHSSHLAYCRDVFCIMDESLNCSYASQNCESITGVSSEECLGEGIKERIAPDHLEKIIHYLHATDTGKNPVLFQIKHEDGKWRWCEMQLVETEQDKYSGDIQYKCVLRNSTELVTTKSQLEKARLEADLANKSRSEFLANMSHELRTPLNAILGFAQMMETGTFGAIKQPKYNDYIENIQESGHTLLSKVNDLLDIANIDSGRMELNESPADLTQLIRQAIEFHSHHAFSNEVKIRETLPATPMSVRVDRIRMLQVLTNVLSNAIRFSNKGGIVEIYCKTRKDGGINIVVEDNGDGIHAGHLQNILSAFRQTNSFFARSRDCVGLGLALSKEIVKLHQGKIDIISKAGEGTTLTIHLPKERTVKKPVAKRSKKLERMDECLVN